MTDLSCYTFYKDLACFLSVAVQVGTYCLQTGGRTCKLFSGLVIHFFISTIHCALFCGAELNWGCCRQYVGCCTVAIIISSPPNKKAGIFRFKIFFNFALKDFYSYTAQLGRRGWCSLCSLYRTGEAGLLQFVFIILNSGGGDGVVRDHYIELGSRVWCSSCSLY